MIVHVLISTEDLPAKYVSPQDRIICIYGDPIKAEKERKKWVRKNKHSYITYTVEAWEVQ